MILNEEQTMIQEALRSFSREQNPDRQGLVNPTQMPGSYPAGVGFVPMYYQCFNRVMDASAICKVPPDFRTPMLSAW
eukprot:gene13019-15313_t